MHVCCIYVRALRNLRNNIDNYKVNGALIPLGISYISSSLQLRGIYYRNNILYGIYLQRRNKKIYKKVS